MPGPLLDAAPFQDPEDEVLGRLVSILRATLDPDAIDLDVEYLGAASRSRRRLHPEGTVRRRSAKERRPDADGVVPGGTTLDVRFEAAGGLRGTLTLVRRGTRPWTVPERERFDRFAPLLSLLLEAAARGEADRRARQRLEAALEATDVPVLVLDEMGSILFANKAADELLSRQTEEGLAVLGDDRRSLPLVTRLIRLAGAGAAESRERLALTNGRSLDARIVTAHLPAGAVRVVTLTERAALSMEDIRPLLVSRGISDREAEVVSGVLRGLRNAQIAGELFICEYTVKDHLKHVFGKLGVTSRGGLIQALHHSTAPGANR